MNSKVFNQDDGKGGLSLRGVAVMIETAIIATTAKTITVASLYFVGPAKGVQDVLQNRQNRQNRQKPS